MALSKLEITRKTGKELITSSNHLVSASLLDFWQWSTSDILDNLTRGKFAEFIVAVDLGISKGVKSEWESCDLYLKDGVRVEVKASSYLQSWYQKGLSTISFDIAPKLAWNPETNAFGTELKRHNDFYVFCLLHHKDKQTVDPMNMDQWTFYVLKTEVLNNLLPTQKRISLKRLLEIEPATCQFGQIRTIIEK